MKLLVCLPGPRLGRDMFANCALSGVLFSTVVFGFYLHYFSESIATLSNLVFYFSFDYCLFPFFLCSFLMIGPS